MWTSLAGRKCSMDGNKSSVAKAVLFQRVRECLLFPSLCLTQQQQGGCPVLSSPPPLFPLTPPNLTQVGGLCRQLQTCVCAPPAFPHTLPPPLIRPILPHGRPPRPRILTVQQPRSTRRAHTCSPGSLARRPVCCHGQGPTPGHSKAGG